MQQEWTAAEVRTILGLTQRRLDYWDDRGYLSPSGSRARKGSKKSGRGPKRLYSYDDLLKLKLLKNLRDAGLSLQAIAKAVRKLRKRSPSTEPLLEVLFTDGKKFERVRRDGKIEDLLADGQLVFGVVSLHEVEREVRKKIVKKGKISTNKPGQNRATKAS